ncbi:hypothetical protein CRENBAI_016270 [Crenichthys baileyi]|uniref:Transforming acidic coiled-coil-containing protein C-terminal domain-containing protein n=1 Tax=Crenichthys baileyi TaxID=28760 RepID=A0AAV9RTA3_9TELE
MGNESSTTETLPEEGAPENVVLFPPKERLTQTVQTEAESLSGRDNWALLSQPVLPEVPVITGVEEGRGAADQEDKEELEFPHDLLPSLDFSSELNIWECSLGVQSSSDERECEQVNPLLAGLQHHMVGPLLVLDGRYHMIEHASLLQDCGQQPDGIQPVIPDVQASPQPGPLTPSPTNFLDQELQMALQECEEQMASLCVPASKDSEMTQDVAWKTTSEVMVNESRKSFSPPPFAVQTGHSNRSHGNNSTHGNSEAASSQTDTVVFSFRDYILGTETNSGKVATERKVEANQSLEGCSELKAKTWMDGQKEKSDTNKESSKEQRNLETLDQHVGPSVTTEINSSKDFDSEIKEEGPRRIVEAAALWKDYTNDELDINVCTDEAKADCLDSATSGAQKETGEQSKTNQSMSKSDEQISTKQVGQNKEAKKKKHKKKKKIEKGAESERKAKTELSHSEIKPQNLSPFYVYTRTDLAENATSELDTELLTCGEQTDYKQQLSPGGMLKSYPQISLDHLTATACSPVSMQALSQKTHQPDNHNNMDAQGVINQSSKCEQDVTKGENRIHTTPATNLQTTAIKQADYSEKGLDVQKQEAIFTTEAKILTEEDQIVLCNSRTCVGDSYVETGLGKALIVVNALPLTTPTLSEVTKSEREGESVSCYLQESVAMVAVAESEEEAGEGKLRGRGEYLRSADVNSNKLLESPRQVSLICSQANCTLPLSAKEGETACEESCSNKMPHNLAEAEIKGERETCIHSADTEISPAEETDTEKELLRLKGCTTTFAPDFQDHSAARLERSGEGGGRRGGEVGEKEGLAGEHNLLSQPKDSAGEVSLVKAGACLPRDVAESQLKSQCWGEPIATFPEGSEEELFYHKQHDVTVLPLPSNSEQQERSSNTDVGIKAEPIQELASEEALSLGQPCQTSFLTERNCKHVFQSFISPHPLNTSQRSEKQARSEQQARSDQQVGPRSTEERTAESIANTQGKTSSLNMTGRGALLCASSGGNRVHFADDVNLKVIYSETLTEMPVPGLDCASLPPLTVHEKLHHPVTEASYTFPNLPCFRTPETHTNAAIIKDEAAIQSLNDVQEQMTDAKLDKEDTKKVIALDHLHHHHHERNAVDLGEMGEAKGCSKQILSPTGENQIGNEDSHIKNESENSGKTHLLQEHSSLKQDVAVTLEEKEESQHNESDGPTFKTVSLPEELLDTDLHLISKSEADSSTCTGSQPPEPTHQLSCYLDETPPTGLAITDVMESTEVLMSRSAGLTKEVTASVSNPPFVLQPPGPMRSHLECITDCDISLPKQADSHSADGDCTSVSREVASNKSGEINQMSLVENLKQSSSSFRADETCQKLKDGDCAEHLDDELQISCTKNLNNLFSQVENLTLTAPSLAAYDVLSKDESDNVMSTCRNKPDSTISETSDRDDLVNIICPTSEMFANTKDDSMGEKKKLNEDITMDNQEEAADKKMQQAGKTYSTLQHQQYNVKDKEAVFMEAGGLQPQHKHNLQNTESPPTEMAKKEESNESLSSKCESTTSSPSPSRASDGFLPPQLESSTETQTVYEQGLSQTVTAALECSSDTEALLDLRTAFGQSQNLRDLNSFAQELEQREQRLGFIHSTGELSGGTGEGEVKTCSWIQPVVPEERDSTVQSLFESEMKEKLFDLPAAVRVEVPSSFPADLNGSESAANGQALVDTGIITVCSQAGEIGQRLDVNKNPDLELGESDRKMKPDQTTNVDQQRTTEMLENSAASVEFASQKPETSPIQNSVLSKVSTDCCNAHVDGIPCANRAEEVYPKGFGTMQDVVGEAETGEEDFSAASTMESKQCEIKDAELQSCNETSDTVRSQVVQMAIKGSNVEEIRKDEAELVEEREQREVQVAGNDEDAGNQVILNLHDNKSGTESGSGLFNNGVPQNSTEAPAILSEGGVSCAKAARIDDNKTDNASGDAVIVSNVVTSTTTADPNESEKLHHLVAFSESPDCTEVNHAAAAAASQRDAKSLEKTPACSSLVDQDVSESSDPDPGSQEPDTNWIQALKEAASLSQSKQVSTQDALRPLPSLESPQVEFLTPTEEIAAPLRPEEAIPPPEEAEEKTARSSCLSTVKRPVDLPKPLEKVDLPEPTKHTADLTTKAELPEESSKEPKPVEPESSPKFSKSDRKPVEEAAEQTALLKSAQEAEEIPEPTRNEVETRGTENLEDLQPTKPREETVQQEQQLSEKPEEKPTEVPPVEPFKVLAENTEVPEPVEDPSTELQDCG